MSEHLKQFHGGVARIRDVHWRLSDLSAAFRRTGNDKVADELYELADQLTEGMATVEGAFSEELDRSFRQAQEASGNMLRAALAGISIKGSEDDRQTIS